MVTTGAKMTTLAALSLHFPFVWYGFLLTANNAPGPTPWQLQGKMVTTGAKMTTLAALSLHFPFVWYGFL
ncbi:hypothetical protein CQA70_29605, partial [Klebsiella pneumoniae]